MRYDTYSKYHKKIDLGLVVPEMKPFLKRRGKDGKVQRVHQHVRASNMEHFNFFTGKYESQMKPIPEEFKSIMEVSCRCAECPYPFNIDVCEAGICYNCIYCLTGGTKILLSSTGRQKTRKIKKLRPGDKVLGYDENKKSLVINEVKKLMERIEKEGFLEIETINRKIEITKEHPVYVKEKGWTKAMDLNIGDELILLSSPSLDSYKKTSSRLRQNNPMKDLTISKKNSETRDNNGFREKMSKGMKERWENNIPYAEKVSKTLLERNPMRNSEIAKKQGFTRSKRIQSGEIDMSKQLKWFLENREKYAEKAMRNSFGKLGIPSKGELKLRRFFELESLPFEYVGDGRLVIEGKNPDFIDTINQTHIIEFAGDTYHRDLDEYISKRRKFFQDLGFSILFLLKKDLQNWDLTKEKVLKFVSNPVIYNEKITNIRSKDKVVTVYNIETTGTNNYFAEGILVHNCFSTYTKSSLYSSWFDGNIWKPRFPSIKRVRDTLNEVLLARGTEPKERKEGEGTVCGSFSDMNVLKKAAAQRIPLRMGNRSECFLNEEKKYKTAEEALRVVKEHQYPLLINTKSDLLLEEPYFSLITGLDKVAIQVSIIHMDDKMGKRLEPGAPKSSKRFDVVKKFNEVGVPALPRLEPIMAFINDDHKHLEAYAQKTKECGTKYVLMDSYSYTTKSREIAEAFLEAGFDFDRMFNATSEFTVLGTYLIQRASYYLKKQGLLTSTFDFSTIPYNDTNTCCAIDPIFGNWYHYNMYTAIDELINKKKLTFSEFDKKYYGEELDPSIRTRIRAIWNQKLDDPWGPYGCIGVETNGVDEHGDLIYKFNPKRLDEEFDALLATFGGKK